MRRALCFLALAASLDVAAPRAINFTSTDPPGGQIWAVLVAGSNQFYNYRHQADICHAYQIFRGHNVPADNIIVMMYDDIAKNSENPFPGKIFNKPNGKDVYHGVNKDYTGKQVTPENFVRVLTGDTKGKGKVLKSGPNDHVFVNFVDHGATGIIGFPDDVMYADDLIKALKKMHKKKMYKKLVFYMEACESGSMFDKILPKDINIFATTASNPDESSWGCYCDWPKIPTCLGDHFSVTWMEDCDEMEKKGKYNKETLHTQFVHILKKVNDSHPQQYGAKDIENDYVKDFDGSSDKTYTNVDIESATSTSKGPLVSSWEMAVHYINKKIEKATTKHERKELLMKKDALLKGRKTVDQLIDAILSHVTGQDNLKVKKLEVTRPELSMEIMPCYRTLVDSFNDNCVDISKNTYVLRHLYKFANLCLSEYSQEDVLQALTEKCEEGHRQLKEIN